jgi:ABC-2 type transport system permease protein
VRTLRLVGFSWLLQLKMPSRSAFDGALAVAYPLFFATTVLLIFRSGPGRQKALLAAVIGSAVMAVWSATSSRAAFLLQQERHLGTLELLMVAPVPFALILVPVTLAMATVGIAGIITTLIWGRVVFGVSLVVQHPVLFVVGILVTVLAVGMMGFVLSLTAVRYRSAWALGAAMELPIWLICGFLVPLSLLPDWVRPISWVLAPTWGMDAIRAATVGGAVWADLAGCVGLLLAYAVAGAFLSERVLTSARARATVALA